MNSNNVNNRFAKKYPTIDLSMYSKSSSLTTSEYTSQNSSHYDTPRAFSHNSTNQNGYLDYYNDDRQGQYNLNNQNNLNGYQQASNGYYSVDKNYKHYLPEEVFRSIIQQELYHKRRTFNDNFQSTGNRYPVIKVLPQSPRPEYYNEFMPIHKGFHSNPYSARHSYCNSPATTIEFSNTSQLTGNINKNGSKFRLLPCRTFISTGTCPYHDKCVFLHDPRVRIQDKLYLSISPLNQKVSN